MDLSVTTIVAQQYPTSLGFISTFKFYNIILFLFPTCNFNLKSSLFTLRVRLFWLQTNFRNAFP